MTLSFALAVVGFLFLLWLVQALDRPVICAPRGLSVLLIRGENMANVLTYQISVAAPVDVDVVGRVLTVTVDGVEQSSVQFAGSVTDLGGIEVPQDAQVVLSLVDVDDVGNKSEPATFEFTALDTLAPAQPGGFTVTLVSEHDVPTTAVVEEPVVDAPVVEEPVVEEPSVEPEQDSTNG
jgi:hypothetical protein